MTDDAAAIHAGLLLHRATLETGIAALCATFTAETGLVVTKLRLEEGGAVVCRVELGREPIDQAGTAAACCEHDPGRHAKDGCWAYEPAGGPDGGLVTRCPCRKGPGWTSTDG